MLKRSQDDSYAHEKTCELPRIPQPASPKALKLTSLETPVLYPLLQIQLLDSFIIYGGSQSGYYIFSAKKLILHNYI